MKKQHKSILSQIDTVLDQKFKADISINIILSILKYELELFWVGTYELHDNKLLIGQYQGSLPCLEIQLGKGVCGTVALSMKPEIIDDVNLLDNYIACHPEPQSELVYPGYVNGSFAYVLDCDSETKGFFKNEDLPFYKEICDRISRYYEQSF
jgi:GAF domain-containing protein